MSRKDQKLFTPDERKQIGAGIAVFVGSLTLAALLKPLAPWSRRYPRPSPSETARRSEEEPRDDP